MNDLIKKNEKYLNILTKYEDRPVTFKTIGELQLKEMSDFMPEINRATTSFNKTNSQTTASLMTLTMLEGGPYRTLRQILAQIEQKRMALKEAYYKHHVVELDLAELEEELSNLTSDYNITNIPMTKQEEIKVKRIQLDIAKKTSDFADSHGYIESALKEIGHYQEQYKAICKNFNIPENWDEKNFEEEEISHHIKMIFRNAIRDLMSGSRNHGTMEYMEQFGINPISGYAMVEQYLMESHEVMKQTKQPLDIDSHYQFLDSMVNIFKDSYKKAAKRIGIDSVVNDQYLYMTKVNN